MVKPHISTLAAALFLASSLHAAEVRLGPEVPAAALVEVGEHQVDPQIALGPSGLFTVWGEKDLYEVHGALSGAQFIVDRVGESDMSKWVGWPAVAAGNRVFLVVWRHNDTKEKDRVYARRYDFNGQPVDAQPLILDVSDSTTFQRNHTAPSIAFDGSGFLVAWTRPTRFFSATATLQTVRIGEEGPPAATIETQLSAGGDNVGPRAARALWTGSEFFVAYTVEHVGHAAGIYVYWHPAVLRFDRNNTLTGANASLFFGQYSFAAAATLAGSRATFAWIGNETFDILVGQTKLDGSPSIAPRVVVQRTPTAWPAMVDIAWTGSEHVLLWVERTQEPQTPGRLRALRLDRDLRPIDVEPFDVSSQPVPLDSVPSMLRTPSGVTIAYSRIDEANGGKGRIYTRTLDALSPGSLPDLAVSGLTVTPNPVLSEGEITISYRIENRGGGAAPPTTTYIAIRRGSDNQIVLESDVPTPTLAPGASVTQTRTLRLPRGPVQVLFTVTVTADRRGEIAEESTSNNSASTTLNVGSGHRRVVRH